MAEVQRWFMGYPVTPGLEPGQWKCEHEFIYQAGRPKLVLEIVEACDGDGEPWVRVYAQLGVFAKVLKQGPGWDYVMGKVRDWVWRVLLDAA